MASDNAIAVVHSVPVTSGSTPYSFWAKRGVHEVPVRNSTTLTCRKNSRAGIRRESTIPIVVRIETPAAATRKPRAGLLTVARTRGSE
jgi:hypothetical protein